MLFFWSFQREDDDYDPNRAVLSSSNHEKPRGQTLKPLQQNSPSQPKNAKHRKPPPKYTARQGSRMTIQCKFGRGNRGLAHVAMGTVSGSNPLSAAAQMQTRRRQRKRTRGSTVNFKEEGRASYELAKTTTASHPKSNCGAASSVSRRSHVGKATRGNLRDHMTYRVVIQRLSCLLTLVASTISASEGLGDASWGVGEAHSIGEGGDSITQPKRRSLACMRGCFELRDEAILLQRSRRLGFL